jgi:hypothetical protein
MQPDSSYRLENVHFVVYGVPWISEPTTDSYMYYVLFAQSEVFCFLEIAQLFNPRNLHSANNGAHAKFPIYT